MNLINVALAETATVQAEQAAAADAVKTVALFGMSMGILLALFAPLIPNAYSGVTQDVRSMATRLLIVTACAMPLYAFSHCAYFTLRSGGKTIITFLFDSGYTWVISVPLALLIVNVLHADIVVTFAVVEAANLIKCIIGYFFVKSGRWIQNLTRVI